ncbi:hypothetical protein [Pseudacidovorax intermedius]|uniref:hypothetical protein n=1 Tax=Pseudacidovorax intermedius TaxID=433924 RepID=UPI0005C293D7|nr:hypothetical protein [Pseudacidovorax intermedius]
MDHDDETKAPARIYYPLELSRIYENPEEMAQAEGFDLNAINRELAYAAYRQLERVILLTGNAEAEDDRLDGAFVGLELQWLDDGRCVLWNGLYFAASREASEVQDFIQRTACANLAAMKLGTFTSPEGVRH